MSYRFLEAEDWNALIARVETIEGMGGAPHTFDSHTDVDAYSEALGDIPRWDGDSWSALAIGSANDILIVSGGVPIWSNTITVESTLFAKGSVQFLAYDGNNEGAEVFMASPLGSGSETTAKPSWRYDVYAGQLRFRSWDGSDDKTLLSLDSAGNVVKIQPFGFGDVSLFEDQTTATQRELTIHAPNSPYYAYIYHNTYDVKIGNSYDGRRIDFECAVYFEGSASLRDGGLLRIYNADNTSYINIQCQVGTDSGVGLISCDDGGLDFNPNGPMMLQLTGRGDVSLFEEQVTSTQRKLSVYAPNSSSLISMYHDTTQSWLESIGNLHITPGSGNAIMRVSLQPLGTQDESQLIIKNAASMTAYGAMIFKVDGNAASLFSAVAGGGTEPSILRVNVPGSILLAPQGEGNVTFFHEQTTATQRSLQVYAPNSGDFIQLYHDDVNAYINNNAGGIVVLSNTAISIQTGANEWQYYSAGGSFRWQDVDDSNKAVMNLDTSNNTLTLYDTTVVESFYFYQTTTNTHLRNSVGRFYLQSNDGIVEIAGYTGNHFGQLIIRPCGTADQSWITMYNDPTYADSGQFFVKLSGTNVSFDTAKTGSGTEPTDILFDLDLNLLSTRTLGFALGTTINELSIDGSMIGNSDDAVPTEQAVKTYVASQVSGGGTSTLQRHVVMDMQPYDGATWDFENGAAILINADSQKIHAEGMIPDGATRFKVLVWSEHITSSDTTYMQFKIDGKEDGDTSATAHHNVTSEWASTSANEQMVEDSGWQTLDAGNERIYVELERITAGGTDDLYVQAIALVFELDVGNTIGSSAKTELLVPCQIAPYDGAVWNYANGVSIFLDAVNQKVLATGYIPANTEKIEVIIFGQHPSGSGSTSVTTTIKGQECGTTSTESYATDTSAWTSTLANEQICKTLGWYATDADQERFFIEIKWNSGTDLHINEVILNCFTPIVVAGTISNPSDSLPADMPDSATAGVSDDVSRADHIHPLTGFHTMQMEPSDGADWHSYSNAPAVRMDVTDESCRAGGSIVAGFTRFRVNIFYHSDAPQTPDIGLISATCDGTGTEHLDDTTQTVSFSTGAGCVSTSWYSISAAVHIGLILRANVSTRSRIRTCQLEYDTESS